jgi:tRNA (mo5U34)-methyltransferase
MSGTELTSRRRLTRQEIERRVQEHGPWFHNLDLGGVRTAPDHFLGDYPMVKWRTFEAALPSNLQGKSVLDIGCNAGFFSIEMKRRGAARVVGIDTDTDYLRQAKFAAEVCGCEIELRELSVYEVDQLNQRFDLVLFTGVLYHLRHPLLALDLIRQHVVNDLLVFQAMQRGNTETTAQLEPDYPFTERRVFEADDFPCAYFIEHSYSGDPTNWWIPNRAGAEAMLRSSGFDVIAHPETEVYVCRRALVEPAVEAELMMATRGRS